MKRFIKKLFIVIGLAVIAYSIANYKLIIYGMQQLKGQLHIIFNTVPVEEVIIKKTVSEQYIAKLLLIQKIRKFAVDSLGLNNSSSYTTLYDQHDKPVLWVLTACPQFEMNPYEWHFPFLGNVSYKGFFKKEIGLAEETTLKNQLYDTDLGTAGGWSTLGWLRDPILSNMLKRKNGQIAELIIHELTHATVYLSGNVEYNENLATFIGEQGAIRFLNSGSGIDSSDLQTYLFYKNDEEVFGNYMVTGGNRLDSLYSTFGNQTFREKLQLKYKLILEIINGIKLLPLHHPEKYIFRFPGSKLPNNTWFLSFKRYRSRQKELELKLNAAFNGNLNAYIQSIKNK